MFIKDKLLPDNIDEFIINKETAIKINKLFDKNFINNLLIYGHSGCGKYTLFIKQLEKILKSKIKLVSKNILLNLEGSINKETTIACSEYHFEINLNKYSNNKNILFSLIDSLCESKEINQVLSHKIILIRNIHSASIEFVKYVKQKAEMSWNTTKFIVISNVKSIILKTLTGVFTPLKVPNPLQEDILLELKRSKIKLKSKDKKELIEIIKESKHNLNIIFSKLEINKLTNYYKTVRELTCKAICNLIKEPKISNLYDIRNHIYEYQTQNEDLNSLIYDIYEYFSNLPQISFSDKKKIELIEIVSNFNTNNVKSYKQIIHTEATIFNIFKLYNL